VGLVLIASSCGLIGGISGAGADTPRDKPTTTTSTASHSTTTVWTGGGTKNGFCSGNGRGSTDIPPGDQGWHFVLTSPDPGPWELTATFAHSGTIKVAGTEDGSGSVHFLVITLAGDQLLSASSTNGGHNLIPTDCTLGPGTGPYGPSVSPGNCGNGKGNGKGNGAGNGKVKVNATANGIGNGNGKGNCDGDVNGNGGGNGSINGNGVATSPSGAAFTGTAEPSGVAFTGAELALLFAIGAVAIGVGGMLVLATRRRRSPPAYEEMGESHWTWPKQK
jgi:hypothetical protein